MRAITVVQQLCSTCFKFYCMFYFTCVCETHDPERRLQNKSSAAANITDYGQYWVESLPSRQQCTNINRRRLGKGSDGMNVIVENNDADHHPQAKHHRLLRRELGPVFPAVASHTKHTSVYHIGATLQSSNSPTFPGISPHRGINIY